MRCFECQATNDVQRYYVRIVPRGQGCEVGHPRNLCPQHREELVAKLATDQSSTFAIMPIAEYEQEREVERILRDVVREVEREIDERCEKELLRLLDS